MKFVFFFCFFVVLFATVLHATVLDQRVVSTQLRFSQTSGRLTNGVRAMQAGDRCLTSVVSFDFNGDGNEDVMFGCPGVPITLLGLPVSNSGGVYLIFLNETHQPISGLYVQVDSLILPLSLGGGENFGASLAILGIDSSNRVVVAVGVPGADHRNVNGNGGLQILRYNPMTNSLSADFSLLGNLLLRNPLAPNSQGAALLNAGDLNSDGLVDICVGVPGLNQVRFMTTAPTVFTTLSTFGTSITLGTSGNGFGSSIALVDDLDGDGMNELAVGAPLDETSGPSGTCSVFACSFGALYIVFLQNNLTLRSSVFITSGFGGFEDRLSFENFFGVSALGVPDLNGDQIPDVAVGALGKSGGGIDTSGAFYILFMNRNGTVLHSQEVSAGEGNLAQNTLTIHENFGSSLTFLGDSLLIGAAGLLDGATPICTVPSASNCQFGGYFLITTEFCSNGNITASEICDDGNLNNYDGCSSSCDVEPGFTCVGSPSFCFGICGDSQLTGGNQCDDGNTADDDGCSSLCLIELGWNCTSLPSVCTPICGDNFVVGDEQCDDGNVVSGDGCNDICRVEIPPVVPGDNAQNAGSSGLSSLQVGAIVGALGLFCLLSLCCICIASLFYIRREKRNIIESTKIQFLMEHDVPTLTDISIGHRIGQGHFGSVFSGDWRGTPVALKSLNANDVEDFANELKALEKLRHGNIISFFGIYVQDDTQYMVTEYMNRGSLLNLLKVEAEITTENLIKMAYETSKGMEYLHSQKFIHRDLACRNILVNGDEFTVKVADFGLSRQTEDYYKSDSKTIPIRWTAPEAIEKGTYSNASDVWAYGIVMWEIFSRGNIPYAGMSNKDVIKHVNEGYRLKPPHEMPQFAVVLMKQCWTAPKERPYFEEIRKKFEKNSTLAQTSGILHKTSKPPTPVRQRMDNYDEEKQNDEHQLLRTDTYIASTSSGISIDPRSVQYDQQNYSRESNQNYNTDTSQSNVDLYNN